MVRRMTIAATEGNGLPAETAPAIVHLVERLCETTGSARATLRIPGPEARSLPVVASAGLELGVSGPAAQAMDRAAARVLDSADPLAASEDRSSPLQLPLSSARGLIRSLIFLPVIHAGRALGVATLISLKPDAYGPAAKAVVEGFICALGAELGNLETTTQLNAAKESRSESENLFETLTGLMPEAVFVITGSQVVYANPFAERLFDVVDPGGFIGRIASDLVHPDYREMASERRRLREE